MNDGGYLHHSDSESDSEEEAEDVNPFINWPQAHYNLWCRLISIPLTTSKGKKLLECDCCAFYRKDCRPRTKTSDFKVTWRCIDPDCKGLATTIRAEPEGEDFDICMATAHTVPTENSTAFCEQKINHTVIHIISEQDC